MSEYPEIQLGANIVYGHITYKGVAETFEGAYTPIENFL